MSPTGTPPPTHLRSARMLDVEAGAVVEPGDVLVVDGRIAELAPAAVPAEAEVLDLGDVTLLPGLMDMEVNLAPRWSRTIAAP